MGVELAEICRQYGEQYLAHYGPRVPTKHRQVIRAVERCRTDALGGHIYRCPDCQEQVYRDHSCRNRHCPKCQHQRAQQWLEKQQDLRLPVPYFLLTFTLPEGLRAWARQHQKLIYQLLFRTSAAATQQLAQDPRFVGGKIGMVGVMHTWGRNLSYHPHIHSPMKRGTPYLVPAGGLTDGGEWSAARQNFLVPVKALSKLLRAKFRTALRKQDCFAEVPTAVWQQDWVVHGLPVGDGEAAFKYLAPYIFRVAITNNRILKLENGQVTFRYRDTQTRKTKHGTLTALEFMRRFLQHVLPMGFVTWCRSAVRFVIMGSLALEIVNCWLKSAHNYLHPAYRWNPRSWTPPKLTLMSKPIKIPCSVLLAVQPCSYSKPSIPVGAHRPTRL